MRILVTGGAGYIGSHTVFELISVGHEVCVVDNLENGFEEAINRIEDLSEKEIKFFNVDLREKSMLEGVFSEFKPDAVIHFAGLKSVAESVKKPLRYYENNVIGSIRLLEVMEEFNCTNIVFSSSATVYGDPKYIPIDESHSLAPKNPYGTSKLMIEKILEDWCIDKRKARILRYFNPVGAHQSGEIGESPKNMPNNIMPLISDAVTGKYGPLKIFGDDWDTRDGTGERDYIHVVDLAQAHLAAIESFASLDGYEIFNIGTGVGVTVKELVAKYEKEVGSKIKTEIYPRRNGDVARSIASPKKAALLLKWESLRQIHCAISSTITWKKKNPNGYQINRKD